MERFYTFGYVSGVIGMVVALGLLVWTTWTLVKPVSIHKIVEVSKSVGKLMKRDVQKMNISYEEFAPESPITPIVRTIYFLDYCTALKSLKYSCQGLLSH